MRIIFGGVSVAWAMNAKAHIRSEIVFEGMVITK
jgi:hypothetical protein